MDKIKRELVIAHTLPNLAEVLCDCLTAWRINSAPAVPVSNFSGIAENDRRPKQSRVASNGGRYASVWLGRSPATILSMAKETKNGKTLVIGNHPKVIGCSLGCVGSLE